MKRVFRIEMPEATVNFKKSAHKDALEYEQNSNYAMQLDLSN